MNSIIGTYASEKFVYGKPTGEFSLDKEKFESIAHEVVHANADKTSPGVWIYERLPKTWDRADVNKTGRIDAGRVPMALRDILDNDPKLGWGL